MLLYTEEHGILYGGDFASREAKEIVIASHPWCQVKEGERIQPLFSSFTILRSSIFLYHSFSFSW